MTQTIADPESSGARLLRRVQSIPAVLGLTALTTALLPLLVVVAVIVDVVRSMRFGTAWMGVRLLFYGWLYLWSNTLTLASLLVIQLVTGFGLWRTMRMRLTYRLQTWWTGLLLWGVRVIFQLRFEVAGLEAAKPGPLLIFMQHASSPDTLIPTTYITRRHGIRIRFVAKRELLADPCLDIAGHWLPNCFVDRHAEDTKQEVARIRALANDLGPTDAVLIYPEGTRFTKAKQARVMTKLERTEPAIFALAKGLDYVLPPHLGGPLALLDGDPHADVLFIAHHGFSGFGSLKQIWGEAMVRRTIHVEMWRVPRAAIPTDREARVSWLYGQWYKVDSWMAALERATPQSPLSVQPPADGDEA